MVLHNPMLTRALRKERRFAIDVLHRLARALEIKSPQYAYQPAGTKRKPEHEMKVEFNVPSFLVGDDGLNPSVVVGEGRATKKAYAKSLAALEAMQRLEESMKLKRGGLVERLAAIEKRKRKGLSPQQEVNGKQQEQANGLDEKKLDKLDERILNTPVEEEIQEASWASLPVDPSFKHFVPASRKGSIDFDHVLRDSPKAFAAAKSLTLTASKSLPRINVEGLKTEALVDGQVIVTNRVKEGADPAFSTLIKHGRKNFKRYPDCVTDEVWSFGMAKLFAKLPKHHFSELKNLLDSLTPPDHPASVTRRRGWRRRSQFALEMVDDEESHAKRLETFRSHQKELALPVDSVEEKIPHDAPVTVVRGGTGSGKTTRYPLMLSLLSPSGPSTRVVVAQPRRLACQTAAHRVASEQDVCIGEEGCPIGYSVRFDSLPSTAASRTVDFQTPGVILRRAASDALMRDVTHLVIDEVHERNADMDLLLALAKDVLKQRANHPTLPPLRLILMSATLDASHWESYFEDCIERFQEGDIVRVVRGQHATDCPADVVKCVDKSLYVRFEGDHESKLVRQSSVETDVEPPVPVTTVDIPNVRRFPIDIVHLEDDDFPLKHLKDELEITENIGHRDDDLWEAAALLAAHVFKGMSVTEGSILCFLPGMEEIESVERMIQERFSNDLDPPVIAKLHSSLTSAEQAKAFVPGPKIILSTNIAETSVTIPDVKYVIDPGRERQFSLLESKSEDVTVVGSQLVTATISQASASQRAGRAGRVSAGTCYRLYTKEDFDEKFEAFTTPEMLRRDLSSLILHCLSVYHPVNGHSLRILQNTPDPPIEIRLSQALRGLEHSRLLNIDHEDEENVSLTPLGSVVADLPTLPRIGRMLIMGLALRAIEPALKMAALLSVPRAASAAARSFYGRNRKLEAGDEYCSDLVKLMDLYDDYLKMNPYYRWRHPAGVEFEQVGRVLDQLEGSIKHFLLDKKFPEDELDGWNTNGDRLGAKAALVCVATPHIAHLVSGKGEFATRDVAGIARIHPWSVNASHKRRTYWYLYDQLRTTKRPYLHMTTAVSPLELALFSEASDLDDDENENSFFNEYKWVHIADQWVPVQLSEKEQEESFLKLHRLLTNDMLQQLANDPSSVAGNSTYHRIVLHVLSAIEQQRLKKK